ncbi:hypothetical protein BDV27DRAFT_152673 [Aspergillus caelatus]|uniref:Uncharacterized protein n=1 Tax=Aspergillus caelatus TaxID=61420 RepID=A0A5N7AIT3_9EURO|nr:uncharacterized protein BDV27DRAFT_152673 [Aspergillus caelatus]KAE8369791.1 hypothetical protein BDV27DRAFT_152673 [Aspergillus caelatus]
MKVSLALASISLVASSLAVPFTREIPGAKRIERRDDNTGDATVDKAGVWAGPWVWKRDENSADATVDKAGVWAGPWVWKRNTKATDTSAYSHNPASGTRELIRIIDTPDWSTLEIGV